MSDRKLNQTARDLIALRKLFLEQVAKHGDVLRGGNYINGAQFCLYGGFALLAGGSVIDASKIHNRNLEAPCPAARLCETAAEELQIPNGFDLSLVNDVYGSQGVFEVIDYAIEIALRRESSQ